LFSYTHRMTHRVYMNFMLRGDTWFCQFLLSDLKTPLPQTFTFADFEKVREMAKRGGAEWTSADRQTLEYAFTQGRGAVWLKLTDEQMERLR